MNKLRIVIELDESGRFGINVGGMSVFEAAGMLDYAKKTLFDGNTGSKEEDSVLEEVVEEIKDEE